ncbi:MULTISPECIES: class II holin family protein [Klebsiella]|uniref:Holin n=1 Tax=Siphoviridae sp. cteRK31 TaxID=2826405 RepID=A0A8S5MLH7_9CAUD|nr:MULTISPECIES: class II holin family protein [Klebsiella]DAD82771.1 MAG TPA: holin [Siphoviridae sp. cteRK31]HDS4380680.1 class II holin family protein [Klebsiella aerogenes]EGT0045211.1 lysis protein [Klebsiella oxytoca]ELR9656879.1 class II holin family protein [Klebsiella oxytoca]MBF1894745.1 class II holin family protein [Klebsiella oxytoca]
MNKIMPDKIASSLGYCTSGGLICWGSIARWIHELDWNLIAVIGGFIIGLLTFLVNFYFKRRQTKAYEKALARGYVTPPPQDH